MCNAQFIIHNAQLKKDELFLKEQFVFFMLKYAPMGKVKPMQDIL